MYKENAKKRQKIHETARKYVRENLMSMLPVFGDVGDILDDKFLDEGSAVGLLRRYDLWMQGVGMDVGSNQMGDSWSYMLTQACNSFGALSGSGVYQGLSAEVTDHEHKAREDKHGSITFYYACTSGARGHECDCVVARERYEGLTKKEKKCAFCDTKYKYAMGLVLHLRWMANDRTMKSILARSVHPPYDLPHEKYEKVERAFATDVIKHDVVRAAIPNLEFYLERGSSLSLREIVPQYFYVVPPGYKHDPRQRIPLSQLPLLEWTPLLSAC